MKIYIDISVLTLATFITGIQRVTREIVIRLMDSKELHVILLHYNAKENKFHKIDSRLFRNYYLNHRGKKEKMVTGQVVELTEIGLGSVFFDLDAAWMCRVKRSYLLPLLKKQGAGIVAHIYDIISITHPQYCLQRGVYNFMDYIGAHLLYADTMIVNARATAEELKVLAGQIGVVPPACHAVPLGADYGGDAEASEESGGRGGISGKDFSERPISKGLEVMKDKPYLLMVGTIEPRKNHKLLLKAYDAGLKALGYNIVFAGYMGWDMEEFEEKLKSHPDYGKRIFHFDNLDDTGITYLYQHARFLVFCSYTEGFGLPLIESILRKTPVLAADVSVYREVAGDYCVYFKQDDADGLCALVRHYEEKEAAYEGLVAYLDSYQAVSWDVSGDKMKDILLAQKAVRQMMEKFT